MFSNRIQRVRSNMDRLGLVQILVSDPTSLAYLLGCSMDPGERLCVLLLRRDDALLFCNRLFCLPETPGVVHRYHEDGTDPVQDLADAVDSGNLGIDKFWPAQFLISLMEKRPDVRPVQGSAPVDLARKYKDADELALLRRASRINDRVMAAAIDGVREGMDETSLARIVCELYAQNGADGSVIPGICFGANASDPHHMPGECRLKQGDAVLLDLFAPADGYWCDMTRTVFFGHISKEQMRVYDVVRRANQAGIRAVRPGVPLCEIDRAARRVIEEAGYGANFTHRLGHGIGLSCHEPPDCSGANGELAEPGMCFSIEPGIYLPGCFGVRIEDLVSVTEDGVEVLNQLSRECRVLK